MTSFFNLKEKQQRIILFWKASFQSDINSSATEKAESLLDRDHSAIYET